MELLISNPLCLRGRKCLSWMSLLFYLIPVHRIDLLKASYSYCYLKGEETSSFSSLYVVCCLASQSG